MNFTTLYYRTIVRLARENRILMIAKSKQHFSHVQLRFTNVTYQFRTGAFRR